MNRLPIAIAFALLALSSPGYSQERAPNRGSQSVLRTWPKSGVWEVALTRLVDGGLGCLLITAHANQASGERYFWGLRQRDQSLAATIIDNNERAIAGPSIQIVIDQVALGSYPIIRRINGGGGFNSVGADLPARDGNSLLNLIRVAGAMQFVTDTSTYSASLEGAQKALLSLDACMTEAKHLGAALPSPARP